MCYVVLLCCALLLVELEILLLYIFLVISDDGNCFGRSLRKGSTTPLYGGGAVSAINSEGDSSDSILEKRKELWAGKWARV